jgi:long-chain acyl-CoA synthetase
MGPLASIHADGTATTLLFLPLAHVFARVIEVGTLEAGIVLGHCPDMNDLLPDLASFKPTFVLAVPRVFEKVYNGAEAKATGDGKGKIFARATQAAVAYSEALDAPGGPGFRLRAEHALFDRLVYGKLRAALGGRAEWAISGGAALAPRLGHFFRGVGVSILEGYGLTETTAPVSVNRPDRQKIGSVGQPLPGVTVRIADDGEVLVRGPLNLLGYLQPDGSIVSPLDEDGWLATGDVGLLDEDGFLTITDRKKELLITAGGKNIAPTMIESYLTAHPAIGFAAAIGDRRPFVTALIVLDPDVIPEAARQSPDVLAAVEAAVQAANSKLARVEQIKRYAILPGPWTPDSGEVTPKLSLRRRVITERYADVIESLYEEIEE